MVAWDNDKEEEGAERRMNCHRCRGLLVATTLIDASFAVPAMRCVNCGNVVEPEIHERQQHASLERAFANNTEIVERDVVYVGPRGLAIQQYTHGTERTHCEHIRQ